MVNITGIGLADQIKENAAHQKEWRHWSDANVAYQWFDRINEILYGGELPQAVIGFDDVGRMQKDYQYHYEGDDISLAHHIDLKKGLVAMAKFIALLKAMEQMKAEVYGTKSTWYHSKSWRTAMDTKHGLTCGSNGDVKGVETERLYQSWLSIHGQTEGSEPFKQIFEKDLAEYMGKPEANPDFVPTNVGQEEVAEILSAPITEEIVTTGHLQDFVSAPPKPEVPGPVSPVPPAPPKIQKNKTVKWFCGCVNGYAPDGSLGSLSFWSIRIAPHSTCGACGFVFETL